MANYYVELSGSLSLPKQSKAIAGEEALGSRFLGSRIWANSSNVLTNLAEFEEINEPPAEPLKEASLTKTLSEGITPEWAGPMIVAGSALQQVYLIRPK